MGKEKSKVEDSKEIEPWDDFNEVDLSKKRYASDEWRDRQSEVQKRLWNDPAARDRQSEVQKRLWNDPTERSKRLERIRSKEVRERVSNTLKENWKNNPEYRERQTKHLTKIAKTTWDRKLQERGKTILSEFREVHGDRYDYSKVNFQGMTKKVTIICPDHGEFQTIPSSHLKGVNCQTCSRLVTGRKNSQLMKGKSPPNKRTTEQLVQQFIEVHGDRYDYSKVEFVNQNVPVIVICRKHGEFKIREGSHRKGKHCPKCPERQVP